VAAEASAIEQQPGGGPPARSPNRVMAGAPHRHDPPAVGGGHAMSQLASISALLRVGAATPFKSKPTEQAIAAIATPGALVEVELPPVPRSILDAYASWTGARSGSNIVPAHLFPQWTFPPMIKALQALPFPMTGEQVPCSPDERWACARMLLQCCHTQTLRRGCGMFVYLSLPAYLSIQRCSIRVAGSRCTQPYRPESRCSAARS
jgi:hypothetical protein